MSDTSPLPTVTAADLGRQLAAPFAAHEVKLKAQVVKADRALAVAYVDARAVMTRLDDVFGCDGWQTKFTPLADGNVACELSCRFPSGWVVKGDVGGPSEQPDSGDRMKAAYSDALKRAAVHYGVGRYLYRSPSRWLPYNAQTKQFVQPAAARQLPATHSIGANTVSTTNSTAPKALPAAATGQDAPGILSAEERWKHLCGQAERYGAILHVAPELVLRDLKRTCGIREGTPPSFFSAEEWDCLTSKLVAAIRKRSVLDPAPAA